jgi:hypothetical protein
VAYQFFQENLAAHFGPGSGACKICFAFLQLSFCAFWASVTAPVKLPD